MDIYKKIGVSARQFYVGFGFAILGVIAELFIRDVISVLNGSYLDTFGTILGAWIGCFFGLLIGVSLDGYFFLKRYQRQNEFVKFFIVSLLGISVGFFVIYLFINMQIDLPVILDVLLVIIIPTSGIITGSILVLTKGDE